MEGGVTGDNAHGHGMIEDEVGEESPVFIASRGRSDDPEPVLRKVDPEQFGGQGMVLGMVGGGLTGALQSIADRVHRVLAH
jgi:hypothetical protein